MSDLSAIHGHARPIYDKRNRMAHFSYVYEGFTLSGTAEIEPGYKGDPECPPYEPGVTLIDVYIDGKLAADILNPKVEEWLCDRIIEPSNEARP